MAKNTVYKTVIETVEDDADFKLIDGAMYIENDVPKITLAGVVTEFQLSTLPLTTGWATYTDTQYTSVSPLAVTGGVDTLLPNNAGSKIESQIPIDITTFYDGTVITGRNGDNLDIQIYFEATPSAINQWIEVWIDITAGTGLPVNLANLYKQTFSFPRGVGESRGIMYSLASAYTLGTWEANGGKVYIASNADITIYGITYNFDRSHKAR